MVYDPKERVQRELNYAIIDEVDSILIDEARTPLIISTVFPESTKTYYFFAKLAENLKAGKDYILDEKRKTFEWTDEGQKKVINFLQKDPWGEGDFHTVHKLENAIKAKEFFQLDRDYIIKNGEVIIVDEFTGRLMPGRRWSAQLHQAIEAKEWVRGRKDVRVKEESITLATITFQNYFRMYKKLAGMTGTAFTSAEEFYTVYNLEVVVIPTNKPMIRVDLPDKIFKTEEAKFRAIVEEIKKRHKKGQPVLVGTRSIQKNEYLSKLLQKENIPHQVLNAKYHEKEAQIIAQAGKLGAVTVATNMAGRGVDIILGGNPPDPKEAEIVKKLGGLHVIGTERHEARRIDNQLRGRAGRQGDPGSSQFFISLEDELIRIFGGDEIKKIMTMLDIPDDQPIESKFVSKVIDEIQNRIEGYNFDLRKHLLEYDNVMNVHRETFYKKRREILESSDDVLRAKVLEIIKKAGYKIEDYEKKEKEIGPEKLRQIERFLILQIMDRLWIDHLENMEYLRDVVNLRAYAQRDPLVEYKAEANKLFKEFLNFIEKTVADTLIKIEIAPQITVSQEKPAKKPGRNDPCPCGSGKKYKKCCWPKYG
jgi:preprotein translocase subunit SecA